MTTIFRRVGATIGSMALLSLGGVASAQESADSVDTSVSGAATYHAGDGIKLSDDLLMHPRVDLEGGYQSNVFFADDTDDNGDGTQGAKGSPLMRVGVGAGVSTNTDKVELPKLVLSGDIELLWNQYLSGNSDINDRSDMGITAMAQLDITPKGPVGFTLSDNYVRAVNPPPAEFSEDADRDKNSLNARLALRPGGGALEIFAGAGWDIDIFESNAFTFAARNIINFNAGAKWQWLPKTQINTDVNLGLVFVDSSALRVDRNTSTPLKAWVGISTLITPNFGTVLRAGYGNSFQSGEAFNSYLALAELRYAFGPTMKSAIGYSHDFADSVIGNFRADHSFFARFAAIVNGQFELNVKAEVRFRDYGGIPPMEGQLQFCGDPPCSTPDRSDTIFRFSPVASYQINEWLNASARYSLLSDTTDAYVRNRSLPPTAPGDSFGFVWQEFMIDMQAKF
jgi:hypothetical protein